MGSHVCTQINCFPPFFFHNDKNRSWKENICNTNSVSHHLPSCSDFQKSYFCFFKYQI